MPGDVDHVAVWRANEEPSSAPGSVVSGWTISNPASFRFLVGLLDAVADGDGDHRVVRSGGIAGDELGGAFGGEADLGLDPGLSPAGHHLLPGEGDLRVGRPPRLASPGQRGLGDGEPVVPGPGRTRLRLIPQTRLALDNQRIVRPRRPLTSTSKSKPQAAMR